MDASATRGKPLGVRHALLVYTSPVYVFSRVEDTGAYGWALVTLIVLMVLLGYIQVQSGLIDRLVDEQTQKQLAQIEGNQANLVDRTQLRDSLEEARQGGEFMKTLSRLQVIVLTPAFMLCSFLLIASILYACVALSGRKPEYHTLMSICVYAGFVELVAYALRVLMMLYYRRIDVDTTLAVLGPPGEPTWLAAIDPFRIWFWTLVAIGLIVTRQLGRRSAIAICSLMCLTGMGLTLVGEYSGA